MSKNELQNLTKKFENVWDKLSPQDLNAVMDFSEKYKTFMDSAKTEREAVFEIIKRAKEKGFIDLLDAIKEEKN